MNPFILSAFWSFIFTAVAGFCFVLKRQTKSELFFGLFWLVVAYWTFLLAFQFELMDQWISGFLWGWLLHAGCIFVPVLFFHFTIYLIGERAKFQSALVAAYLTGGVFLLLIAFSNLFTGEIIRHSDLAYPKPSVLYPAYILFFQVVGIFATWLIFQWRKAIKPESRKWLHLFLSVHIIAYLGVMDNYMFMYEVRIFPFFPYGLYGILPYAVVGSYAFSRLRKSNAVS
ncbi:MAG: hypothetical protein HY588_01395 [Candidatus Omnitrophica bacterium]|nr:hypothetical protein [Candidatus Omnitrophota bacterium]